MGEYSLDMTQLLTQLCTQYNLPPPLYDLEAVGDTFTMCCLVGRVKETSSDRDKTRARNKAAAKVYDKLKKQLENKEDILAHANIKNLAGKAHKTAKEGVAPTRRPSLEDLSHNQSLEQLCSTTGLCKPVYDMEAVGDQITMCCIAGTVKQTATATDKNEAKIEAANKVLEKLLTKFQGEDDDYFHENLHLKKEVPGVSYHKENILC